MDTSYKRRRFLYHLGRTAAVVPAISFLSMDAAGSYHLAGTREEDIILPAQNKKLGVALVGLGNYSENQLAPALQETLRCKLTAIVTGTPEKAEKWKKKYSIPD